MICRGDVMSFVVICSRNRHGRDNLAKVALFMRRESGKEHLTRQKCILFHISYFMN